MTEDITEWEFTADVASWINLIVSQDSALPFKEAKCEQRKSGSQKRRDLTLLDKDGRVVITGEVKLPFRKDGGSPYNAEVVKDARKKASVAKARYFFTWNVNECVLWETEPAETGWQNESYRNWQVTSVYRPEHMRMPMTETAIKNWLPVFLRDVASILFADAPLGRKSPDQKFIDALEAALSLPINFTLDELGQRYKSSPKFKAELDQWMRDEQGWIIRDDPEGVHDNLDRAAKFSSYALLNRLVFHEALLKRYGARLKKLEVPKHIDNGEALRNHLEAYFAEAKLVTGDYETVFGEDHTSIGHRIPFYADSAVGYWRDVINQIHKFDFSKLDYEIIGTFFERLISPEERRKFGQFYTRVEVVDLINSFCIHAGTEKVLDPACGGGTFLVRAYARKRELAPARKHHELLGDLFGVDVSQFATHLTTINLATRDLIDAENYPQIARSDFFAIEPRKLFLRLPHHIKAHGLGKLQHREIELPALDAVVGNPPYIRQEELRKAKHKAKGKPPERGTKDYYQWLIQNEASLKLSGRSDIHCYFWPHAAAFLKEEGYLCLLTSSQWLDVEYGFRLQAWMLQNFEIVTVFESIDEPWFVGARVATTVTILRRCRDPERRMANIVRFVQLRRPMGEILAHDGTTAGAVRAADDFRDEILGLKADTVNVRYRARLVPQRKLWEDGVQLGRIMKRNGDEADEPEEQDDLAAERSEYYGGKWGLYLRAPDLWFDWMDRFGSRFAPLGELATVKRGITSGKDEFFFPIDASNECLAELEDAAAFQGNFGVPREEVESGRIKLVRAGPGRGEIHAIEAEYLEPEVHSLMEINGFVVRPEDCKRLILLVGEKKDALQGTHVLKFIQWGEKQGYHTGSTCASRVSKEREWYDLTGHPRGQLFWPKTQKYRHAIPVNGANLQANCNLYDVTLPKINDVDLLAGVLNSTMVVLSKLQFGRYAGTEGTLKTEIVDVNMMLVPNLSLASTTAIKRIIAAFRKMKSRPVLHLLSERRLRQDELRRKNQECELTKLSDESELSLIDRQELDDAVLELIGFKSKTERVGALEDLYSCVAEIFEANRRIEEKTNANKRISKRRNTATPQQIAQQVYEEILTRFPRLLKRYDPDFFDHRKPFDTFEVPMEGEPHARADLHSPDGAVEFLKGRKQVGYISTRNLAQPELIVLLMQSGQRGFLRVPHEEAECRRVADAYMSFLACRKRELRALVEERTADENLREAVLIAIQARLEQH